MPVLPTWKPHRAWGDRVIMAGELTTKFGSEPKPCPFCQSKTVGLYMGPSPHMTCGNCGADGPVYESKGRDDLMERQHLAFEAWQASAR